ncbi:MAG: hypothetical protein JSR66_20715 [Proteobacteria bacterium]|nr:hypothetical protein [Pseudomonadota bacterium]
MSDPRGRLPGERGGAGRDLAAEVGRDEGGALGRGERAALDGEGAGAGREEGGGLAQLIGGLARSQPPRRAPASLEARVFARIAARPWWSKGFAHWPVLARAAFLVASFGFIKLTLVGVMWAVEFVRTSDVAAVDTLHRTSDAVSATVSLGSQVLKLIPPGWLYIGAGVGFVLYAVLFGLGTLAYRTLYVQR